MLVWSLGREDSLEEGMATPSSSLAWRIPWTEEPGRVTKTWARLKWLSMHTQVFSCGMDFTADWEGHLTTAMGLRASRFLGSGASVLVGSWGDPLCCHLLWGVELWNPAGWLPHLPCSHDEAIRVNRVWRRWFNGKDSFVSLAWKCSEWCLT